MQFDSLCTPLAALFITPNAYSFVVFTDETHPNANCVVLRRKCVFAGLKIVRSAAKWKKMAKNQFVQATKHILTG